MTNAPNERERVSPITALEKDFSEIAKQEMANEVTQTEVQLAASNAESAMAKNATEDDVASGDNQAGQDRVDAITSAADDIA
jgi:hypothetical protein